MSATTSLAARPRPRLGYKGVGTPQAARSGERWVPAGVVEDSAGVTAQEPACPGVARRVAKDRGRCASGCGWRVPLAADCLGLARQPILEATGPGTAPPPRACERPGWDKSRQREDGDGAHNRLERGRGSPRADLVRANGWSALKPQDARVVRLSRLLQDSADVPEVAVREQRQRRAERRLQKALCG